ncbi:hypothetical protein FJT64_020090 [Amphibalanus amphitrite]|uniref:Uncharacterized protein n=1 Tax=Amphibalanus amphitrite TaxID=1232801 RepID=A0A6A4X377_AMPAM|nr:hypothetical protein FJT64_020090 [Amphibalanus amphitrite]
MKSSPSEAEPATTTSLPGYLIKTTPDGVVTIMENNEELPKYFTSYPSTLPGLMMVMVQQPTVEDAVEWLLERHIYCIIITSDGEFFYPANGVPSEEDLLSSQPKPDGEKMEVVILNRLEKYAPTSNPDTEATSSTAVEVPQEKPTVVTATPMETYYVRGDQPSGSLWQLVVLTSVSSRPEISCIYKCNTMGMPWVAFRMGDTP